MEYGKLQGETVAAGHVSQATGAASLIGVGFNVASVAHTGVVGSGTVAVTLGDGVDQQNCVVTATCDIAPATVSANNAGIDTDTVKNFAVVDAAGAPLNAGFYFSITRTNVS